MPHRLQPNPLAVVFVEGLVQGVQWLVLAAAGVGVVSVGGRLVRARASR